MTVVQEPTNGSAHASTNVPDEEVDLIIIGAGPTGLLSALLARQLGLSVCVLDAKEGPLRVGGADAITARVQQYLEVASNYEKENGGSKDAGILGELLNHGVKCSTSSTFADGTFTSRQSHWWTSLPNTFYTTLLMIGQPFIERHLTTHIDTAIHYAEPALTFSHTLSPPSVTVNTAKRSVKGRFCLAADGARSFMRQELGIAWEGEKPNMVWTVLDCWIDTTFPVCREIVTGQVDGESRLAWIPRERGMQRFYVLLDGEITQQKAEDSIRRHLAPHTIDFTHVEWFSRFEIKERIASTLLHPTPEGPFILAGDAAHVHSVNGGQGMNTGLSDAFSLIWRLYFTLRFPSLPATIHSALLSSYHTERHATATNVIDVAAQLVRSTTSEAKKYVALIEKNAGFISGMGVRYDALNSPAVREGESGIFKAGCRVPDLWLQEAGTGAEGSTRLYEHIVYGRYVLLLVGLPGEAVKRYQPKSGFASVVAVRPLKGLSIGVEKVEEDGFVDGEEDVAGWECALVKKGERFAVLVRPDCYVEAVGDVDDVLGYVGERLPGLIDVL